MKLISDFLLDHYSPILFGELYISKQISGSLKNYGQLLIKKNSKLQTNLCTLTREFTADAAWHPNGKSITQGFKQAVVKDGTKQLTIQFWTRRDFGNI